VALTKDGTSLTLIVAQRRSIATHLGVRLFHLGFHSALLLDGGPSTQLEVEGGGPPSTHPGRLRRARLLAIIRRR
jgi:hypothetical protein